MKNAVFDTSVAIKWFFPETGKEKAVELKDKHLNKKIILCTRDLFLYELASAFKNYTQLNIEEEDFSLSILAIRSLKLHLFPLEFEEMKELYTFSKKLDISIYDCSYLLLAKKLQAPLYTADKKLYQRSRSLVASFFV